MDVSDQIKAIISIERSVYELFKGSGDLQYTPADLAKDSLPLLSISLFTHHILYSLFDRHPFTHTVYVYYNAVIFYVLFMPSPICVVHLHFISYSSFIHLFVPDLFH